MYFYDIRWTSQRACLDTFIRNHPIYVNIRDNNPEALSDSVIRFLDNRLLWVEAKNMLIQLDSISVALNSLQVSID